MSKANYSMTVTFGGGKPITKTVDTFPTKDAEFIKQFCIVFTIPEDSFTSSDRKKILDVLKQLISGKKEVVVELDLAIEDGTETKPVFKTLQEFLLHYIKTSNRCYWVNYANWPDFNNKIAQIFIKKNPPQNIEKVVIVDFDKKVTYDLKAENIKPSISNTGSITSFYEQIYTEKNTLFILEDIDLFLRTNEAFEGELDLSILLKTRLKNLVSSTVLNDNNSFIIVAAGATEEVTIPKQLRGFWVQYQDSSRDFPVLEKLGTNLTAEAIAGKITEEIKGREKEIDELIAIFQKQTLNNVLLKGKAGVGKTAIMKGLAVKIAKGDVPDVLRNVKIFDVPLSNIMKDTGVQGSLESKVSALRDEVKSNKNGVMVFFDEFHQIVNNDIIRNILKPELASGQFPCIGATTDEEYRKDIAGKDTAFIQRFAEIQVNELPKDIIKEVFKGIILKSNKNLKINDEKLEYLYSVTKSLKPIEALPRSGIRILENIISKKKNNENITKEDIKKEFNLGKIALTLSNNADFTNFHKNLINKILGQESQIERILSAIRKHFFILTKVEQPLIMLFMGPTGTGKTEFAIQLSRELWGTDHKYVLFNMGGVEHKSSILGAEPSFVGYEDKSPILNFMIQNDSGIIILDEFEKVFNNAEVLDTFLEMFDKGTVTDRTGLKYNCRPFIFILTSNLGKDLNSSCTEKDKTDLIKESNKVRPEFIGRISLIEVFNRISDDAAKTLLNKFLNEYNSLPDFEAKFSFDESALKHILESADFYNYGARNLKRVFSLHMNEILLNNLDKLDISNSYIISFKGGTYILNEKRK
jgi:ATP-dependent Clp protease ATP-binding subunit ClpA